MLSLARQLSPRPEQANRRFAGRDIARDISTAWCSRGEIVRPRSKGETPRRLSFLSLTKGEEIDII